MTVYLGDERVGGVSVPCRGAICETMAVETPATATTAPGRGPTGLESNVSDRTQLTTAEMRRRLGEHFPSGRLTNTGSNT